MLVRLLLALAIVLGAPLVLSSVATAAPDHMAMQQPCNGCDKSAGPAGDCMAVCVVAIDPATALSIVRLPGRAVWPVGDWTAHGRWPEPALTPPRA